MSDERREAGNYTTVLVRAIIAAACSLGAGLSYTDEIDAGRDELLEYIAGLEEDRALLEKATAAYVGTDFEYPGYEKRTCLILAELRARGERVPPPRHTHPSRACPMTGSLSLTRGRPEPTPSTITLYPPGSDEARAKGCTCPVIDNCRGRGAYSDSDGKPLFWITETCALHAAEAYGALSPADDGGRDA